MEISISLINQCRKKDRLSQKQLYRKLLPYLRAVARRYLREQHLLKDVLQETFLLIFKNLEQFDLAKGSFIKWAVRITINTALNYNKRVKFDHDEIDFDIVDKAIPLDRFNELSRKEILVCFKQMPYAYYEVFNLFIVEGYDHEEIAEILKIKSSLSRKRLSRARDWIKNKTGNMRKLNTDDFDFSKHYLN